MAIREEFRESVRSILELLSSKELQLKYEKDVPIAHVPSELLCTWFDDLYHPDSILFQKSFSQEELEILERFNKFYDERTKGLPNSLDELHRNPEWQEIMNKAEKVLNDVRW